MKVLIAGDTHGDIAHVRYLIRTAVKQGIRHIVQVGDFGYWPHMEPFHERVNGLAAGESITFAWLDGNHENFDALEANVDTTAPMPQPMASHLTYLPRGCTWTWDGCRFMALGGAYSIDKEYRTEGRSWWPQELLTREQVETAMDRGPVDVLLTHDAPDGVCPIVTPDYKGDFTSQGNRKAVLAVLEAVTPRLLVHGHYHHRYSGRLNGTQVEGLGRDGDGVCSWLVIDTDHWATHNAPS